MSSSPRNAAGSRTERGTAATRRDRLVQSEHRASLSRTRAVECDFTREGKPGRWSALTQRAVRFPLAEARWVNALHLELQRSGLELGWSLRGSCQREVRRGRLEFAPEIVGSWTDPAWTLYGPCLDPVWILHGCSVPAPIGWALIPSFLSEEPAEARAPRRASYSNEFAQRVDFDALRDTFGTHLDCVGAGAFVLKELVRTARCSSPKISSRRDAFAAGRRRAALPASAW